MSNTGDRRSRRDFFANFLIGRPDDYEAGQNVDDISNRDDITEREEEVSNLDIDEVGPKVEKSNWLMQPWGSYLITSR